MAPSNIRCAVRRAVFIEAGPGYDNVVYDLANNGGAAMAADDDHKVVDEAEPDHHIWLAQDATSWDVVGYYDGADTARTFEFGAPPQTETDLFTNPKRRREVIAGMGWIRIQFAKVESFEARLDSKGNGTGKRRKTTPKQKAIDTQGALYKKGYRIGATPGDVVASGEETATQAVLESGILHEVRIHFNDWFGLLTARASSQAIGQLNPETFQGVPTSLALQDGMRLKCIMQFLTAVQQRRFEIVSEQDIQAASSQPSKNNTEPIDNNPDSEYNRLVAVEDIVHLMVRKLSPSFSYAICTGRKAPVECYGEEKVQHIKDLPETERLRDFKVKDEGLTLFFIKNPNGFELEDRGQDEEGRQLYSVRSAALVIEDSDSDSDSDF